MRNRGRRYGAVRKLENREKIFDRIRRVQPEWRGKGKENE